MRILISLALFAVSAWCGLVFVNGGENLLFAAAGVLSATVGFGILIAPLFRRSRVEESVDN